MSTLRQRLPRATTGGLCLLVVSEAGYASYTLDHDSKVVLGRSDECDIFINDPSVSRRHAVLRLSDDGVLTICDMGSANGVSIRGLRVTAEEPAEFGVGEAVTLGAALLIVQDTKAASKISVLPRPYFEARLAEECQAATRTDRPFALFEVSVSGEAGNALDIVLSRLRLSDAVGHSRKNAWFVLMRDIRAQQAPDLAKRLLSELTDMGVDPKVGFACWAEDGRTPQQLMDAAKPDASAEPQVFFGHAMRAILDSIDPIAHSELSVLVVGETGVGKEVMAERIHRLSPRSKGPFLRLNCAALSHDLIASELFGHVKGAFTGADRDKPGLMEMAQGGTIFLDEIGDLHLNMQVKLLRVLEERMVRRVGGLEARPIDVRFVAATNRNLMKAVDSERFRRDLYYRLSGAVVELPPLREREDEIVPLAELFLKRLADASSQTPPALAEGSKRVLRTYRWPGNIRELRNIIERAAVVCEGDLIEPRHFPVTQMKAQAGLSRRDRVPSDDVPTVIRPGLMTGSSPEKDRIIEALTKHGGNQGLAAADLGISRRTLMRRMDAFGIPRPRKGQG